MPLIFTDTLLTTDSTGLYTLQALIAGVWTDIHTIAGAPSGSTEVDASLNTIDVDTTLLPTGQTFQFRWVDSLGNESNIVSLTIPGTTLSSYAAGVGLIDFSETTGDNYSIGFHAAPTSVQTLSGATVVSYDYTVNCWQSGNYTTIETGNKTADYSLTTGGHGSCVYEIKCNYNLSDSSYFVISKLVKVDGTGAITDSLNFNGIVIQSVSGLQITATAETTQSSSTLTAGWVGFDGTTETFLATGLTATFTISPYTRYLFSGLELDSTFADFNGDVAASVATTVIS